ncbi:tyrosine-type recombinase/integrase [Streptomyces sp. NPDC006458]|uniref:tyrosine-type recombinase/integrase n=1 Tax=Streptomyces sp. NPDC006458 TaxID=3154302 RepID=UPI0033ACE691
MPDQQWDKLFAQMNCARDRPLLSCYISSGARASELLGIRLGDVEWQKGQLWVISKGTRARQPVPLSPESLAHLACSLTFLRGKREQARRFQRSGPVSLGLPVLPAQRPRDGQDSD